MGNSCGCCKPSEQAVSSPPHAEPSVSLEPPSIDSIKRRIEETDAIEQIDPLIRFIEAQLQKIKEASDEASTSASSAIDLDSVASSTRIASNIIDKVSQEAEKFQNSVIVKEMGSIALKGVKGIAETHWIFVGLSVVAYALDNAVKARSNVSECIKLLEKIVEVSKDLNKLKEAMPGETEKLCKAVGVLVEGAVICSDYIAKGRSSRYWSATTMEAQLQRTSESIRDIPPSLTLTAVTHIARQMTRRLHQSPHKLLEFEPVGIEKQVDEVKELLEMDGSEAAVAVILCGFGGVGKSTLAASVVQQLDWSSTPFKFCRVSIDENTPDKRSHVVKLQKDIIRDIGGDKIDLRDPDEGRIQLHNVLHKNSCLLFIDNVVDNDYIRQLLPKDLSPRKQDKAMTGSAEQKVDPKLRILITSRTSNLRHILNVQKCKEYRVNNLSDDAAKILLSNTILQDESDELHHFGEAGLINSVAEACRGVPLLLSVFGNHLRVRREENSYQQAIQALLKGDPDKFADEEQLSEKLLFVYNKMEDEEAQEAFLDICVYLHGGDWFAIGHIVGRTTLEDLQKRMLVNKSESNEVMVHDILRLMGRKESKRTRLENYKELSDALEDESTLKDVKGISLLSETSLTTIESAYLHATHRSLRVLILGDWVALDGPPCHMPFKKLRYLVVGDMAVFPFEDISKMEELRYFKNRSKPGMDLPQFPPRLKNIRHQVPHLHCDAFVQLPLQNLRSLESLSVETPKAVKLPPGFKLPTSLEHLYLFACKQVPERFSHLTALEVLVLDKFELEVLPQGFGQLSKLQYLSLEYCRNLCSVSEGFGSLSSLTVLSLEGCKRLIKLPADLGMLRALKQLWLGGCESLMELPEHLGELSSLEHLDLTGCISLRQLPESFGKLSFESLALQSLESLEELPQSIGNLQCLRDLTLQSCNSLRSLPNSFVQLKMLETLTIKNCSKLGALPGDFGQLSLLKKMTVSDCGSLKELPGGFPALSTLKIFSLKACSSFVNLPRGFGELTCLEELTLNGLFLSSLPDGFGNLKTLKKLVIYFCSKLETLPEELESLVSLREVYINDCPILDGARMESIVKLQQCYLVDVEGSTKLVEQWKKLQQEEEDYPVAVITSRKLDEEEWQRAGRVGLFRGQCTEVNSSTHELIEHPSISVDNDATVAVISLPLRIQSHHHQLLQRLVGMAMAKATIPSSRQLRIIICIRNSESNAKEEESIQQILKQLPQGSCAIPSTDIRRLSLIRYLFFRYFGYSVDDKVACFMADLSVDDKGRQIFVDYKTVGEDDISGKIVQKHPTESLYEKDGTPTGQNEILGDIGKCIKFICQQSSRGGEERSQTPSVESEGQSSHLPEESMWRIFTQALKRNNIDHFIYGNKGTVRVEELEGKVVGLIMCHLASVECILLQQIYKDLQLKNFCLEGLWIPLFKNENYGHGTYSRAIHCMPWATLPNPKLVNIEDNGSCAIVFDREGRIVNQNALPLMMAWGMNAYPFTHNKINEIVSNMHTCKSCLESILEEVDFLNSQGHRVKKEIINSKLVFLYAEPPSDKLKMKSKLEQLLQAHADFEVLYVGYFSTTEQQDAGTLQKMYEDVVQTMHWPTLSFWDMIMFWYRCTYLANEAGENMPLTLQSLVKHLYIEKRWLLLLDSDGVVTASGNEVVEIICKPQDNSLDKVDIMIKDGLTKSSKVGECNQMVRTFFRDELSDYPLHHQHHLFLMYQEVSPYCDVCGLRVECTSNKKRIYSCEECDWDLCGDCWEVFVKQKELFS